MCETQIMFLTKNINTDIFRKLKNGQEIPNQNSLERKWYFPFIVNIIQFKRALLSKGLTTVNNKTLSFTIINHIFCIFPDLQVY